MRQYILWFPGQINSNLECKYKFIFPEYLCMCVFCLFCVACVIHLSVFSYHCKNGLEKTNTLENSTNVYYFFFNTFTNAVLMVYYYNLIAFCTLIKLTKSVNFGLVDFSLLSIRGGFVSFPLIVMLQQVNQSHKKVQSIHKETKENTSKKSNKPRHHEFIKQMPTKQIYAAYTLKKNEVKTFVRVSFANPLHTRSNKTQKKNIFFRFILKIIEAVPRRARVVKPSKHKQITQLIPSKPPRNTDSAVLHQKHPVFLDRLLLESIPHSFVCDHRLSAADRRTQFLCDVRFVRPATVDAGGARGVPGVLPVRVLVDPREREGRALAGVVHVGLLGRT